MTALDIFTFFVFAVLIATVIGVIVFLGMLPGKIATRRGHPQAAAVTVAGWVALLSFGVLWPFAFVWAFVKYPESAAASHLAQKDPLASSPGDPRA